MEGKERLCSEMLDQSTQHVAIKILSPSKSCSASARSILSIAVAESMHVWSNAAIGGDNDT